MEVNVKENCTPLLFAARTGLTEIVALLLERGANKEAVDSLAWTPLHWAIRNGHIAVVSLLLSSGANIEAVTQDGHTALHWAAKYRHLEILTLLLDIGANMEAASKVEGLYPFSMRPAMVKREWWRSYWIED